jgi:hypothetical protein
MHVLAGVAGGFAQFGHGKPAPARRPARGDWVVYYSPKFDFARPEPCRCLTAMGRVTDDSPVQVEQAPGFKPWRRKVEYRQVTASSIAPLIPRLTFIRNKTAWGAAFRFGLLSIPRADFEVIASSMNAALASAREE